MEVTRAAINDVFDNMEGIVHEGRMIHGNYILSSEYMAKLKGSRHRVCNGPSACMLGTLWLAQPDIYIPEACAMPDGIDSDERADYLTAHPVLAHTYAALEEVADEWLVNRGEESGPVGCDEWTASMERLFEEHHGYDAHDRLDDADLLRFFAEARERALADLPPAVEAPEASADTQPLVVA